MSLWINGEWRPGRGPGFSKQDPVNLKVVWQGEAADAGQVAEAVAAARQAFPSWARLPFAARQAIVEKFAALLEASKAELTAVIGAETGKPRWEAAGEVTAMINKVAISVKAYHVRTGEQHSDLPTAPPRCVTGRTAYWRCLAPITFPAICRTGTSCRRCWRAIPWFLNPANSPRAAAKRW